MTRISAWRFALPALLILICVVYLFRGALVEPPKVDPDHMFNTERAFARLERILGDEAPHPVDSDANDLVRERLLAEIETLGFDPIIGDEFYCKSGRGRAVCSRLRNVAFWVGEPGPNAVLIASHYDSVPAGPGASDDGAGVAASLEIAAVLQSRTLSRPVLILITDGEEIGLMGASQFVKEDPLAEWVGAVVNMEARGVAGLAALIQTSRPNGRDLATLKSTTRLPAASSLNADIYDLLPNDTDMTEFLALDIDAANLAFAGRPTLYHTPGDNLANLDKRSLFNIGASGLAATLSFVDQTGEEPESQWLYVDTLGQAVLKLPVWLGGALLALSGLLAGWLVWQSGNTMGQRLKLAGVPAIALGAGLLLAVLGTMAVDAVRVDRLFGAAFPMALRGLHVAAALTGALVPYTFLTRGGDARGLLAAAWLLFALVGGIAFAAVPGASILFVPAAAVFALAALAFALGFDKAGLAAALIGIIVFMLIALPLSALGETGLFVEASAPFAAIAVFFFLFAVPLIWPDEDALLRRFWLNGIGIGIAAMAFLVASLLVPAHSLDAPRALPITHVQGDGLEGAYWTARGTAPLPAEMRAIADFETGNLAPAYGGQRQIAPAPAFESQAVAITVSADDIIGDERIITLDLAAPDTDRLTLVPRPSTGLTAVSINGEPIPYEETPPNQFICTGRDCRTLQLTLRLDAESRAPDLGIYAARFGLGPQGAALLASRPKSATTIQTGDHRVLYKTLIIDPEEPAP